MSLFFLLNPKSGRRSGGGYWHTGVIKKKKKDKAKVAALKRLFALKEGKVPVNIVLPREIEDELSYIKQEDMKDDLYVNWLFELLKTLDKAINAEKIQALKTKEEQIGAILDKIEPKLETGDIQEKEKLLRDIDRSMMQAWGTAKRNQLILLLVVMDEI